MHLFISAGEPSGDLHGSNLIHEIRTINPSARIAGFGGVKMLAAGAEQLYPLTDLAVMWFGRALWHLPTFFRVAELAEDYFRIERPDAVILIDYPGFHWHLAKRARRFGIPVYYFVPPQLWAWAGWRVKKMRKWVNRVLTALPFEEDWYCARGVPTTYVGHPYFDELSRQRLDGEFLNFHQRCGKPVIALLPGSRNQEVIANFPLMVAAAKRIHAARPDVRFLIASYNDHQAVIASQILAGLGLPTEIHVGRTPEIIELANAAISVSGSVGLELMYRQTPTVVVYKVKPLAMTIARPFIKTPYISLVNLLADTELYPEYLTTKDESSAISGHILGWLNDAAAHLAIVDKLGILREKVARPGACQRAATIIATELKNPHRQAA